MLLVQLGINSTRGAWKFCQIGLATAARPILAKFPNTTPTNIKNRRCVARIRHNEKGETFSD